MDHNYYNHINNSDTPYYPYTFYRPTGCLVAAPPTAYPPPRPTPSAPPEESDHKRVFPTHAHGGAAASTLVGTGHIPGHHGGNYPPPPGGSYPTPPANHYPSTGCLVQTYVATPTEYPPPPSTAHGESDDKAICPTLDHGGEYPPHEDVDTSADGALLTNDDVLGDAIPEQQQDALRCWCYSLLNLRVGASSPRFPGSHPVSLNRKNLQFLGQTDYRVTWKADGVRYLMLINSDGCYLIDRKFNFRRVQMRFPRLTQENGRVTTHNLTLLDGEMVIDTDPETQEQERRYLVFDVMAINGSSVIECPFGERWKMLEEQVIGPRNLEKQCRSQNANRCYKYGLEPFRVEIKGFWLLSETNKLLKEFTPKLSHGADGLIFQGWNDKYVPFTHQGLLKWKFQNTVDFLFELVGPRRTRTLYLYDGERERCMYGNRLVFMNGEDPSELSGKIIECYYYEKNVWCFMRVRTDKTTPNQYRTFQSEIGSIQDNTTQEVLLDEIQKIVQSTAYVIRMLMS
ncbi:hypothetical protein MKW92_050957 [Papaver armeniacum]|nr:hypothetical protein MKW92_050957 [Papaver armeniacum]